MNEYAALITPYIGKIAHISFLPNAVIDMDFTRSGKDTLIAVGTDHVVIRDSQRRRMIIPLTALIVRLPG